MIRTFSGSVITTGVLAACLLAPAAMAMERLGRVDITGAPAVRVFDARNPAQPVLTDQSRGLATPGVHVSVDELAFVAEGTNVRALDRRTAGLPERASWSSGRPVLALADGPARGQVLVLDDETLSLVRFPDGGEPQLLWSYPVPSGSAAVPPGHLLVRDGGQVFVSDPSLPGVRVLSLDPSAGPATIATWHSDAGPISNLALWNRTLIALASRTIVVLDTGDGDLPVLRERGRRESASRLSAVDINSHWAFVADGAGVSVLDLDSASPGFLQGPAATFTSSAPILAVRLDKADRLYILEADGYEIVNIAPFGGR